MSCILRDLAPATHRPYSQVVESVSLIADALLSGARLERPCRDLMGIDRTGRRFEYAHASLLNAVIDGIHELHLNVVRLKRMMVVSMP